MTIARRLTVVLLRPVTLTLVVFMLSGPPAHAAAPPVAATEWHSLQVTHNWTMNEQPQLGGEHLVWQAFDGTDWEILTYDLVSGSIIQLTNDGIDESDPPSAQGGDVQRESSEYFSDPVTIGPFATYTR